MSKNPHRRNRGAEPRVQGMGRGGRGWSITCFSTHPREDYTYRARGGGLRVADAPDMLPRNCSAYCIVHIGQSFPTP
jgi:hypothetical protein